MNADKTLLSVEKLSRYYGDLCAVKNISFTAQQGQILGFLGINGAGKSTTMQLLTGTLAPSFGKVTIGGYDLLENPIQAKRLIGYLPENPPLYREMRVSEFLYFCAKLRRVPQAQIAQALETVVEQCGLATVYYRLIAQLSKGYQQRVGIAQAILHNPALIVLDEPTTGLDPVQIQDIRQLIKKLGETHCVILSTHILPEVQAMCSHVQIIHQGELILTETIAGLLARIQTHYLQVALRFPPPLQKLETLKGVINVTRLDENYFKLQYDKSYNPAESLAIHAVQEQWGLYELIPEKQTLEQIFTHLTGGQDGQTKPQITI
ncbi:ABC transporter ATP-binding protein [Beggiatoa leptomitoformis]|uniref:ATP-binding cassette domain-containing protein n=1 Tax=Beggiatoa leptomitoformis TaxID=288004 RepID=A0A2N9YI45_9GAMM|nr:ATP-binding cassette domain-containing protein [Beggiatoa leptomitoformis]ALG67553.1 ATP-binding cassette domain-containing protein [Beggiatoa leptomitoformis]AUI70221.1 ATP-binding cassette domain-containing protein [Beggiatoa leptomitoformis]